MRPGCTYIALLIAIPASVFSQDVHNGTSMFIPNGITLHFDDLDNHGFIQNNGTMEMRGDWLNQGVYQGLGTIILSGVDQQFNNNSQAVQSMLIDGGGKKTIEGKLIINSSLDLASGMVKVDSRDTLLIREAATVEGGSESSFVEGALITEGTGFKFFPVGWNGTYHPITLTDVRGLNPVLQVAAFEHLPVISTSRNIEVERSVYWTQQAINGSYDGSPVMLSFGILDVDPEDLAFVAGENFEERFDVIENTGTENNAVLSEVPIAQSIIAFGTLPPEPVMPGYLSTTLSPNAHDPDNRLIKLFGNGVSDTNFSFRVFNRFGSLLFESTSLSMMASDGWDGKFNGQFLSAGAYPYKLSYVDSDGREGNRTGFITVIY